MFVVLAVPVQIVTKKPNRHIEYGTSLQLSCVAKGIPTPELQWLDVNGSVVSAMLKLALHDNTICIQLFLYRKISPCVIIVG